MGKQVKGSEQHRRNSVDFVVLAECRFARDEIGKGLAAVATGVGENPARTIAND